MCIHIAMLNDRSSAYFIPPSEFKKTTTNTHRHFTLYNATTNSSFSRMRECCCRFFPLFSNGEATHSPAHMFCWKECLTSWFMHLRFHLKWCEKTFTAQHIHPKFPVAQMIKFRKTKTNAHIGCSAIFPEIMWHLPSLDIIASAASAKIVSRNVAHQKFINSLPFSLET